MPDQDPWHQLLQEVANRWPPDRWWDLGVVIGCSGGADSVALVSALAALRQQASAFAVDPPRGFLVVAHFNHRLRGAEADADQQLAECLAQRHGLRWCVDKAQSTQFDEASMRAERMRFLIDAAHTTGARYLALAHSADDNVETVLHHLMRGTGPSGLSGIGSPRSIADDLVLVRPLLHLRRDLIRDALQSQNIPWREDASNLDQAYRRNWIRHQLIPLIESKYPQAVDAITRAIDGQRQWRGVMDRLAEQWLDEHLLGTSPITIERDSHVDPAIAVAALQRLWSRVGLPRGEMTQEHWRRLAETLASGGHERYTMPAGLDVVASETSVVIHRDS